MIPVYPTLLPLVIRLFVTLPDNQSLLLGKFASFVWLVIKVSPVYLFG